MNLAPKQFKKLQKIAVSMNLRGKIIISLYRKYCCLVQVAFISPKIEVCLLSSTKIAKKKVWNTKSSSIP